MSDLPLPSLFALAAALVAGTALGQLGGPPPSAALAMLSSAGLLALLARSPTAVLVLACAVGAVAGARDRAAAGRARAAIAAADVAVSRWHSGVVAGPVLASPRGYRAVLETREGPLLLTAFGAGPRPLPGDRVRVYGRLETEGRYLGWGIEPGRRRLDAAGVVARLVAGADRVEVAERGARRSLWRPAGRLQRQVSAQIRGRDPGGDGAAVIAALIAGDRSAIGDELSAALRRAGVGHLLAVSGLHIGALAFVAFAAARRLSAAINRGDPEVVAALTALAAAAVYAAMTGARPSALRALVVIAVVLLARARGLRPRLLDALGVAAIALVVAEPALVLDPSFQMSFGAAAALSLAFAGRRLDGRGWRSRLATLAEASAWATAATAPVAASMFGELAPIAVVTNIAAVPAVALAIVPLAMLGAALSLVAPALGAPLLDAAIAGAGALCAASRRVAELAPPLEVPPLAPVELALWLAGLAALIAARRAKSWTLALPGGLAAAVAITLALVPPPPPGLRITFVDVGQGDAALIEAPGGGAVLIDAGGAPGGRELERRQLEAPGARAVLPLLRRRGIDRLAVVAISHPHPDHHGGLGALIGAVDIDEVWLASDRPLPAELDAALRALRVLGTRVRPPPARRRLGDAELEVLAPRYLGQIAADPVSSVNDNSLVIAVGYRGRRLLFTGDIEIEGEELLVAAARDRLRADVVKVAHHGSRTSSSPGFVAATGAAIAVVSCGRHNRFGFPSAEVLDRWRAAGAAIARTDVSGSLELSVSDRGDLELRAHSPVGYSQR